MVLVLTNIPERVVEVKDVDRLGKSDHVMIQVSIDIKMKEVKTTKCVPNWVRADWECQRKNARNGLG